MNTATMMTSTMVALRSTLDPAYDGADWSTDAMISVDGLHVRPLDVRLSRQLCRLREYLSFQAAAQRLNHSAGPACLLPSAAAAGTAVSRCCGRLNQIDKSESYRPNALRVGSQHTN